MVQRLRFHLAPIYGNSSKSRLPKSVWCNFQNYELRWVLWLLRNYIKRFQFYSDPHTWMTWWEKVILPQNLLTKSLKIKKILFFIIFRTFGPCTKRRQFYSARFRCIPLIRHGYHVERIVILPQNLLTKSWKIKKILF